ncbi:hypothetical protein C7N43_28620 [Sphingobacteriales bacterium UPWRP_1]|nr:hypothetical protein BVG80_12355 [Sphingobacteriales bacterium TSM_CSM]PSJ73536.1 hypothetical protein C7N43_28620 [Sphingobacteriales bacterium UPWRP_1]
MKNVILPIFILFFMGSGFAGCKPAPPIASPKADNTAQTITVNQLLQRFAANTDTVYVYNFWATWCKPCVAELPWFEKLGQQYAGKKLKITLISLDFLEQTQTRVNPFIKDKGLQSEVFVLDGGNDPNAWINQIDPAWSGAIPATLIIHAPSGFRKFYEREFTFDALEAIVKPHL